MASWTGQPRVSSSSFTSRGWEVELDLMIIFIFYITFLKSIFGLIMTIDVMWTHELILIEMGMGAVLHGKDVFMITLRVIVKNKNTSSKVYNKLGRKKQNLTLPTGIIKRRTTQ